MTEGPFTKAIVLHSRTALFRPDMLARYTHKLLILQLGCYLLSNSVAPAIDWIDPAIDWTAPAIDCYILQRLAVHVHKKDGTYSQRRTAASQTVTIRHGRARSKQRCNAISEGCLRKVHIRISHTSIVQTMPACGLRIWCTPLW